MRLKVLVLAALLPLAACSKLPVPATEGVTDTMLIEAPEDEWLAYGRDYGEQRFSPLKLIDDGNVGDLGLAWFADLETTRGQEATPLVHDGMLYVTTAWSMVKAYDAKTGALKWSYDPEVPRETLARACCDAVNRGVALYGNNVYVGTLDGRLVALDQKNGNIVFEKVVVPDQENYTITGAPRIAKGIVFLGSGGAEFKARGYLGAFDAQTGEEIWRFHTVPGNPADGFENEAMQKAAKTWAGEWWRYGGGGTVWDSITYDPETGLVLFGTGNAEPWSPSAAGREGDSLYTSSIVAVDAETGEYAWHFQETPEDRWDFDSNAGITIADLMIDGVERHVALHAPKNGYFYVLDAKTGEFISAGSFAPQNWTTGIDPETGRPRINPEARYEQTGKTFMGEPGGLGSHSWQSMSYSPLTGLVYIPVNHAPMPYRADQEWTPTDIGYQTAQDPELWALPSGESSSNDTISPAKGVLVAWDPVMQKQAWEVTLSKLGNGGTLSTAGNLLFQGGTDGRFQAYSADKGILLWSFDTGTGIIAAPMTYAIDGEQYVALLAGWGGAMGGGATNLPAARNTSRLLVFKLGATAKVPPQLSTMQTALDPPPFTGTRDQVKRGAEIYGRACFACHGGLAVAGTVAPDLRHSATIHDRNAIKAVIIDGALKHNGMVSFKSAVSVEDAEAVRQYLIKRANDDKQAGG